MNFRTLQERRPSVHPAPAAQLHSTELPLSEQWAEADRFPQGSAGPTGPCVTHRTGPKVKEHGTGYEAKPLQNEATAGLSSNTG